jgi:hypothetical protein
MLLIAGLALMLAMAVPLSTNAPPVIAHTGTGTAHLELDMDPTNGVGPCDVVDNAVTVAPSTVVNAAVCLNDALSPPINGSLLAASIILSYNSGLTASDVAGDGLADLDANPDFNQGAATGGTDWDCNQLNDAATAPSATPSPASMVCTTVDATPNILPSGVTHLATFTLTGVMGGKVDFTSATELLSDDGGAVDVFCGAGITCTPGYVLIPPSTIDGFHRSFYTSTGFPGTVFTCGALVDESGGTITGTVDCTTATGGTIMSGTLTSGALLSADIVFTNPALTVEVDGVYLSDGTALGTWACTVGCVTSGDWTSEIIAPAAPQCTLINDGPGGTLNLVSGDSLVIPPGALPTASENICGELITLPQVVGPGSNILARAYRFTPAGLQFSTPATLNLVYEQDEIVAGMTESNLGIYVYDSVANRWLIRGGAVDTGANEIDVPLDHFSEYAVFDCGTGADSDAALGNGSGIPDDDKTDPDGDGVPDLCDLDDDDDFLPDTEDTNPLLGTGMCAAFAGMGDGHVSPARGDIAFADGNPPSFDTDGDGVLDGIECALGTNPRSGSAGDRNTCNTAAGAGDTNGDGLEEAWEGCGWGQSMYGPVSDADDDGLGDCREVMDVNGNGVLTNGDATFVQQAFFSIIQQDKASMDINRNAALTNGDATLVRQAFFGVNPCV